MPDEETAKSPESESTEPCTPETKTKRPPVRKLRVAIVSAVLCALLAGLFGLVFIKDLLRIAADIWIIDQRLPTADAAYVLGGGQQTRPFIAAKLYHQGIVPRILVSNPRLTQTDLLGLTRPASKFTINTLKMLNVPDAAIQLIGTNVTSTFEEAKALHDWGRETGATTVMVPTDSFHTRRTHWVMNRLSGSGDFRIHTWAIPAQKFDIADWWTEEEGVIYFQNEVIKYLFYRIKY
tara:strand:- start:3308 stop:4015 length:708 start_codon:yes stop_codon:yes gene_type:complete